MPTSSTSARSTPARACARSCAARPTWPRACACPARCPAPCCPAGFEIKPVKMRGVDSERHVVLGARARPVGRPRRAAGCLPADAPIGTDIRELPAARRRGVPAQAHAEPRALLRRARHRARSRGAQRRGADGARVHAGDAADRRAAAGAHRCARPVRPLLRPRDPRREREGARRPTGCGSASSGPGSARSRRWSTSPTT